MRLRPTAVVLACVFACALAAAGVAPAASGERPVSLTLPAHPALTAPVTVVVHPHRALPRGGFYYAVLVLHEYPSAEPACAIASDMHATFYGFAHARRAVHLRLTAAPASEAGWCEGGKYLGAVYADPRRPPCSAAYPCTGQSSSSEYPSGCWESEQHTPICGVVVRPTYSYPGGLPKPITKRTQIVARFTIDFPSVGTGSGS